MPATLHLIDTHTHISSPDFDADRSEVLSRALTVCDYLIDIGSGTSPDAFQKAREMAEAHPQVYFTAGIHPHDAESLGKNEALLREIESLYSHPKCAAVGECGLDYFYKHSAADAQGEVFRWHIQQAQKFQKPLMIHTRDAESDTQKLLETYSGPAVFHCFTGTQELANFGIKKGFSLSFSGIVTFKNAEALRQVFLATPLEQVLIETDSPYLAPVPMRGKRNETAYLEHTAHFLAKLRGLSVEEFAEATSANARRLFGLAS